MNITINGDIYITNYGQTLDELAEGIELDDFDDDEFDYCAFCDYDDCDYEDYDDCDCDCFENFDDEDNYTLLMDEVVDMYVDLLSEECTCEDCTKDILLEFLSDIISLAEEFQE